MFFGTLPVYNPDAIPDAMVNSIQKLLAPIHTPVSFPAIQLDLSNFISQRWDFSLCILCDREDVAEYIKSQRENKPVQSLFELAAQVVELHVVSIPADASKNPVGSDPNFRIRNKSGIAEVDNKVSEVISDARSISFCRKLNSNQAEFYHHNVDNRQPASTNILGQFPMSPSMRDLIYQMPQQDPVSLSLLHRGSANYYMDEKGVAHTHDETFTLNKNLP